MVRTHIPSWHSLFVFLPLSLCLIAAGNGVDLRAFCFLCHSHQLPLPGQQPGLNKQRYYNIDCGIEPSKRCEELPKKKATIYSKCTYTIVTGGQENNHDNKRHTCSTKNSVEKFPFLLPVLSPMHEALPMEFYSRDIPLLGRPQGNLTTILCLCQSLVCDCTCD